MSGTPNNWPELLAMLRPEDVLLAIDIAEIEKIIARLDQQAAFWAAMRDQALAADVDTCENIVQHERAKTAKQEPTPAQPKAENDDPEEDSWLDDADPIIKRKSGNELITGRVERILLVLNQLGPNNLAQIGKLIGQSDMVVRYAIKKVPDAFCRTGHNDALWAATRVSEKWDAGDEAMFGKPQFISPKSDDEEPADDDVTEEDDAEVVEVAGRVLPMAPDLPPNAQEGPAIAETKVEWFVAGEHREYSTCVLCDADFAAHEEICVARDAYGKSVMCKPCAKRAGYQPPSRVAS